MKNRTLVFVALALIAAGFGLWLVIPFLGETPGRGAAAAHPTEVERFEPHSSVYSLRYDSKQAGPKGVSGALGLTGEIEMRRYAKDRIGLVLTRCDSIAWRVLEQDLLTTQTDCQAEVVGREVVLELGAHRRVLAVHTPPELSARAEHLLRGLVLEMAFEYRPQRTWSTEEISPRGRVTARYSQTPTGLLRKRETYRDLPSGQMKRGTTSFDFDRGELVTMSLVEELDNAMVTLALERTGRAVARQAPATQNWTRRTAVLSAEATREEHLRQRVDGLSPAQFLVALDQFADGGRFPDHERFIWRASGLLKQDPATIKELEARFEDSLATHERRAILLDLLASAGTKEAQAAMRRMLDTPVASDQSDRFAHYVQRLSILAEPDDGTLRWIEARYRAANDDNERLAAAYTLASVGRQHASDRERDSIATRLEHDFRNARDERERAHLMRALGATASPDAGRTLRQGLTSDSPSIRFAALDGLARLGARGAVRSAIADTNADVQAAAIRHLSFDSHDADALEPVIARGGLPKRTARAMVRSLAQRSKQHPEATSRIARALIQAGYASGSEAATLHALSGV